MEFDPSLDWRIISDAGFNSHIGPIRHVRTGDNTWLTALELQPHHINFGGVCHGGVYMSVCDVAMGATAYSAGGRHRCATISFDGHFIAAAKLGQTLVVQSAVNKRTSSVCFAECSLWAGGRKSFRASGVWKYLESAAPEKPPSP